MQIVGVVFTKTWEMFSSVNVPGTSISVAVFFIGIFCISIGFKVFNIMFGFGSTRAVEYKAGGRANAKISKERQGDEK